MPGDRVLNRRHDLPALFKEGPEGTLAEIQHSILRAWNPITLDTQMLVVDNATGGLVTTTGGGGGGTGLTDTQLRAAAVPVTGPVTDAQIRATALPVTVNNFPATQAISAVSLPLPAGAAQEHTAAASPESSRLSTGTVFYDGRDRNWTVTETVPISAVSLPAHDVTQANAASLNVQAVGNVASGAADSGNPIKIGGKYNAVKPIFADGQRGDFQIGTRGALDVTLRTPDGVTGALVVSAGDAQNATSASLRTYGPIGVYNGASIDMARGDITNGIDVDVTRVQGSVAVTGVFWQATQPVSAVSLPLPTGAATDSMVQAVRDRLPAALVTGRLDVNIGASITLPVSGTFWQTTQPVSAVSLPLPTGAAAETTLSAMSAKLPAALVGARLDTNVGAIGNVTLAGLPVPTGGFGFTVLPVSIRSRRFATYHIPARTIISGILTANTFKALVSFEHTVTAIKTVRVRQIRVSGRQTTALAGICDLQVNKGTAASSAGTVVAAGKSNEAQVAPEVVVKVLPTIVAAGVAKSLPMYGNNNTTAGSVSVVVPSLIYDAAADPEEEPLTLRAGVAESIVIGAISDVAMNMTLSFDIEATEE